MGRKRKEFNGMDNLAMAWEFCRWVAEWVCNDEFEEDAGFFAEAACRKLYSMGLVEMDGEVWKHEAD